LFCIVKTYMRENHMDAVASSLSFDDPLENFICTSSKIVQSLLIAKIAVKFHEKLNQSSLFIYVNSRSTNCPDEVSEESTASLTDSRDYRSSRSLGRRPRCKECATRARNLLVKPLFWILRRQPDIFNLTEWEGMLSSSWPLNMKLLVILK